MFYKIPFLRILYGSCRVAGRRAESPIESNSQKRPGESLKCRGVFWVGLHRHQVPVSPETQAFFQLIRELAWF